MDQFGIFEQSLPRLCKFNPLTGMNLVEFYSELVLQGLDLLGDRWLPDVEFVGCLCDTLVFCNDYPYAELV